MMSIVFLLIVCLYFRPDRRGQAGQTQKRSTLTVHFAAGKSSSFRIVYIVYHKAFGKANFNYFAQNGGFRRMEPSRDGKGRRLADNRPASRRAKENPSPSRKHRPGEGALIVRCFFRGRLRKRRLPPKPCLRRAESATFRCPQRCFDDPDGKRGGYLSIAVTTQSLMPASYS